METELQDKKHAKKKKERKKEKKNENDKKEISGLAKRNSQRNYIQCYTVPA